MKFTNKQKGDIGETLVSMTLMNMGLDVININTIYRNYKNASKQNAKKTTSRIYKYIISNI